MGREIRSIETGESLGLLLIFVNEKSICDVINSITGLEEESEKTDSDYGLIIDNQGNIVSSPTKNEIGKNISKILAHPRKLKPLYTGMKNKDSFTDKIHGQEVFITYYTIGERGWNALNIATTDYLYSESRHVGWTTFWVGVLFGIFAIYISIAIALNISNPLRQVVNSMKKAENGDFTVRANVKRKDELGYLGAGFDHMIEKIGNLLQETKEAIDAVLKHSTVLEESSYHSAKTAESIAAAAKPSCARAASARRSAAS
jgi:methyl-accepting chemotaxis protein